MKNFTPILSALLLILVLYSSTFVVQEHQQALLIQFGKVVSKPIRSAGIHFKVPFIQDVKLFEKRILQWDGDRSEIPTLGKKTIWVDTTARWKISDPLKFYETVRDIQYAMTSMNSFINGGTKDVISKHNLIECVRNSNEIAHDIELNKKIVGQETEDEEGLTQEDFEVKVESVQFGREKLSKMIADKVRLDLAPYGIEIIDVQIRSIAYKEVVEQKVYNRMISERQKIATIFRSRGKGEKQKILGKLDLTLKTIESEAYKKAQQIRGKAEAEAIELLSNAVGKDPEYYEFVKTLDTYKNTLNRGGDFILSTDSDFFKMMQRQN